MTKTTAFGTGKREGHDAGAFYNRKMYADVIAEPIAQSVTNSTVTDWADRIYNKSSLIMSEIPDNSIGLAFTSPPYNCGKDYDGDLTFDEYMQLIRNVGKEVFRVLQSGGRYVINVANLGRKPYIPLQAHFYHAHMGLGFMPIGEIIWQKAKGAGGNCAWGSWKSAKAPSLRDVHEYLLVFTKQSFGRPDKGESTLTGEEFMESTLSVWDIPAESAKRIGHPAPFPLALADRVVKLYSYTGDVVLDPFCGSGTTCLSARNLKRHYVGYDISDVYCQLAEKRIDG